MPASLISRAVKQGDNSPAAPVPNLSSFYTAALEWAQYSKNNEPWMWQAGKNESVDAVMDMLHPYGTRVHGSSGVKACAAPRTRQHEQQPPSSVGCHTRCCDAAPTSFAGGDPRGAALRELLAGSIPGHVGRLIQRIHFSRWTCWASSATAARIWLHAKGERMDANASSWWCDSPACGKSRATAQPGFTAQQLAARATTAPARPSRRVRGAFP